MVGKNRGLLLNGEIHLFYVTKQLIAHSEVEAAAVYARGTVALLSLLMAAHCVPVRLTAA